MKNKILTLITLSVLSLAMACGGGSSSPGGAGPGVGSVPDAVKRVWESGGALQIAKEVKQTSPKGVTIYSRAGLSQEFLDGADEALTELFADVEAGFPGQSDARSMQFGVYDIYEPNHDCTPSPVARIPSFYVKDAGLQYDESQYDHYPGAGKSVITAPERIFGMTTKGSTIWVNGSSQPGRAQMMVCPDIANWRNTVRYGAEHNVAESAGNNGVNDLFMLGHNNRTHAAGGHPFIPSRAQGLVAREKANYSEFAPGSWER